MSCAADLHPDNLPQDPEALKALLQQQQRELRAKVAHYEAQLVSLREQHQAQLAALHEQLNLALAKRFGASSERVSADQLGLFNEAEASPAESAEEAVPTTQVKGHSRKTPGRKPLPDYLPRVRIEHDLDASDKHCPCGCGALRRIGEEVSEQLDIVPARVQVLQHVRFKYACPACQEGVKTAPLPPQPIPKSNASAGLLAHIAVAKYADALPLYRQEKILGRAGIELPRATLANWMIRVGELAQPLINLLRERLLDHPLVQMDETPVQVLKEAGRRAVCRSYMWVQRGGPPGHPVILFDYDPSRSQTVPLRLLEDFQGYLQTDGYEGYAAVTSRADITAVGCWAHARRKFDEAIKAQGKSAKTGKAHQGLALIQKLYRIEREAKALTPEQRHALRQEQSLPALEQLQAWLERSLPQIPPKSATGKALHYLHRQWGKLVRYLDDGHIPIDNNAAERAIRPFVTGRKNWLFSATPKGAKASANLYSLIETAKANGLEPYAYLRTVFEQLPTAQSLGDIEALLPWCHSANAPMSIDGVA